MTNNGVVLIVAAGNDTLAPYHSIYANIPGVINVSGVWPDNHHDGTGFAHNQWVDICAMGRRMSICMPGNNYGIGSGTSFAAPQVAGTVALMLSVNPNLTPAQIEEIIKSTADPIADGDQFVGLLGAGRLNAYRAVQAVLSTCGISTMPEIIGSNVISGEEMFSIENLKLEGDLLNIPLFLADYTDKLIDIALREIDKRDQ